MTLSLQLFGGPVVALGGATAALPPERRGQLLAYLALKRTWVARSELAALLWPGQDSKLAHTNLRKALFRMQSQPWAGCVEVRAEALRVEANNDVAEFERALAERRLADALRLRRGELLAGFDDDGNEAWTAWLRFERDRLRVAWRAAAQELLAAEVEPAAGAELAARLLDDDPFDEEALRAYMSCLARSGQATRARQVYREFATRLERELGLAPGAELAALHQSISFPRAADALPREAPAPVDDGFVGRTVELRRIASLLAQDDCRLLSIFGPGGVGKTRLARRVSRELADGFPDGTAFVALDDLDSAAGFADRLAREFDVAPKAGGDALQRVVEALRPRRMLLVLDNFEQLADGAPQVEMLLAECPRLKVIVTSRVRLALRSEWLLPLEGLPCPEDDDLDRIESFDASRLFLRAARRLRPDLAPAGEAAAIADICRLVDGLPLALEMAAAWTRVLSCAGIVEELRHGTELLQATDAMLPRRHASIELVFDQSWRQLGEVERSVLAGLSVFSGGFAPEAARAVLEAPLPVLGALVDRSLLHRDGKRLRLHPLVHQLARRRLEQTAAGSAVVVAHSRYFLRQLAVLESRVRQAEPAALRDLDLEFENIRAAWRHAVQFGEAGELMRAVNSLMIYGDHRGRRLDVLDLMQAALAGTDGRRHPGFESMLANSAGWLAYRLDRYDEAEALGLRALGKKQNGKRTAADLQQTYRAATVLTATCLRRGRNDDARRWAGLALDAAQRAGSASSVASALDNLGLLARGRGELDEALRLYRQALLQHREVGDTGAEASCLNSMGVVHILRGELDAARSVLGDARQLCDRHGLAGTRCMVEVNLANAEMHAEATDRAVAHARLALDIATRGGQRAHAGEARNVLAWAALRLGDLAAARAELVEAMTLAIAIGRPALLVQCARLFAELMAAQGAKDVAARVMRFVLDQPGLVGGERLEAERQAGAWSADPPAAWNGMPLTELAHRIVSEAPLAHAPLIAELRGS